LYNRKRSVGVREHDKEDAERIKSGDHLFHTTKKAPSALPKEFRCCATTKIALSARTKQAPQEGYCHSNTTKIVPSATRHLKKVCSQETTTNNK
jgi:hypothetical protein